ncbi:MAG TPA: MATE family efflux transporter [Candidatus Hypogeohydataceae bacterium YC41]
MLPLELTEERLNRNIARLAIPAAAENVLHMMVFIVDIIMVGRLGTKAIAAVGLAGALNFVLTIVFSSLSAGTLSLVARHSGAMEKAQAERVAAQSLLLSIAVGVAIAPILFFYSDGIFFLMGAEPEVTRLSTLYFATVISFLPCRLIILTCSASLRGAGDTRTPMLITLVMNVTNALFNWLLIFGIWIFPRMEVAGAAWGTVIAYLVGSTISLAVLLRGKALVTLHLRDMMGFDGRVIKRILWISLPATLDAFLTQLGYLVFIKIVTMLGTVSLAAHQIAVRIESISFMPGYALGVSTATLVGQSLGAKKEDLARLSMKRNCFFALLLMCTFGVIFLLFPRQLAKVFGPEEDVLRLSSLCVMISAIEQPALAIYMVYAGGLRGAGDTMSPMLITIVGTLFFHVPMAYILGIVMGWGLAGIWFGAALDWIGRSIAVYILFRRGRWRKLKV